jgi:hypothetical protein
MGLLRVGILQLVWVVMAFLVYTGSFAAAWVLFLSSGPLWAAVVLWWTAREEDPYDSMDADLYKDPTPSLNDPRPCPFCGRLVDLEDPDTLYPSGYVWRPGEDGLKEYHRFAERRENDYWCYDMHCPVSSGGCGAEIGGNSREEALAAWNTRHTVNTGSST